MKYYPYSNTIRDNSDSKKGTIIVPQSIGISGFVTIIVKAIYSYI